ncbi:HAD family hydrolase [Thalassoglobus sp. JC818]|uniref:HAD family hydrolase n=1 Tax=Thalassoglobus sp. JC818 TaxID=3232136 RepID=UPI003459B07D
MPKFRLTVAALFALFLHGLQVPSAYSQDDPLPSWNDGPTKSAIIEFVESVTREGSPTFVRPIDRIAVFDNDGTLWPEDPIPFQLAFALDELKRLAPSHAEWKDNPVLQAGLTGDTATILKYGEKGLIEILDASHTKITTTEFDKRVRNWSRTAKHPRFKRPYLDLTYQPMQEVLRYLRANKFKTWIVSGGGADFMRVWSRRVYGIPPEQVIGSVGNTKFGMQDGLPVLIKEPGVSFVDDKTGKPVGIHRQLGRRPIAAFGNSDGDLEMLQWTTIERKPSFALIVHHTDAEREYAYDAHPKSSGKLVKALEQAKGNGWVVVDMKNDWATIFSPEK